MSIKVRPLGDRVLVLPSSVSESVKGGIIIPEMSREKPQEGTVIAIGTGARDFSFSVKEGDKVLLQKYGGVTIRVDGVEHQIVREDDILAILG